MAVNGNLPLDKRSTAKRKQDNRVDIRNKDEKAVLKKAVPVINPALVAAARTEKQLVDRTPTEDSVKYRKIRQSKEKENPLSADYSRQIQNGRNAHICEPEKH